MKTVALGEVTESVKTWNPSRQPCTAFDYIDLSAVDNASKSITAATSTVGSEAPSRARQLVAAGDVLVSTVRPNLNAVAVVPPELEGATASTGFTVLRPTDELDSRYLFHWVRSSAFIVDMIRKATGASYPAVSDRIVKESHVPAPPLPEQRRIAAILDQADALRAKRRQVLAHLDSLPQSIFHEMFGDPARNPLGFPSATVHSLADKFSDGPFGSNLKSSHYVDAGVPVVRLQNIGVGRYLDHDRAFVSETHYATLSKHDCRPGDILIGTLGVPNLRACIQPDFLPRALNKADCIQFRTKPGVADPVWACWLLNAPGTLSLAASLAHGQTRTRIAMGQLRELKVPVPPMDLQYEFSARVAVANACRERNAEASDSDESLFASLQSRAFRGEL